ncbi:MAG: hypothetical protein K0R21_1722 [Anaerocolumna sp.]|jgi:hypothetical protein|nr:hypothetical protein [Anaerocolumna sp.]
MKTVIIKESESITIPNVTTFDLAQMAVKDCTGCWTCWWKTPGKCIYKDLDGFYHEYITSDKAIYFCKVTSGFVSGNLKTLFDRMIPLYLPYVTHSTGESMHAPRYDKYPDIEFYYDGEFESADSRQIFVDYINRVFYQFHSKTITIKAIEEFIAEVGEGA